MDNHLRTMQENGEFHFHKGFYLTENVRESLGRVQNEHYSEIQCKEDDATDYLYTDADIFLHGSCNLFALALHKEFGYEVYEIKNSQNQLVHVFCKSKFRGQDVYIDVRGVTTNCVECFIEFYNDLHRGYSITLHDIEEDKHLENEGDRTGYFFAKSLVGKYRDYYDVLK